MNKKGWFFVGSATVLEPVDVFLHKPSRINIRDKGHKVRAWVMFDFEKNQSEKNTEGGYKFLSEKILTLYDCDQYKSSFLSFIHYSNQLGAGDVMDETKMPKRYIKSSFAIPGSLSESALKATCDKK
jgi:hypothetical protein